MTTPLVIDLGKKRKKQIRKLKDGQGKIKQQIDRTMEALRANGAADAPAVVLIVEEKQGKKGKGKGGRLLGAGMLARRMARRRRIRIARPLRRRLIARAAMRRRMQTRRHLRMRVAVGALRRLLAAR